MKTRLPPVVGLHLALSTFYNYAILLIHHACIGFWKPVEGFLFYRRANSEAVGWALQAYEPTWCALPATACQWPIAHLGYHPTP